ncbi:hypothetical protein [Nonomuraea sp. NPDC050691]|uniref:hypothetical protein n=1 Tax=Nonomuraea sp. NPDC050691 TaxID=3155661 RepID=UPI0033E0E1C4
MHTTRLVAAAALTATTTALLIASPAGAVTTTPAPAVAAPGSFGPYGYGGVRLGMTATQAKATGKIALKRRDHCSGWDFKAHPNPGDEVSLYISKKRGVAVISAPRGARTPEGVAVGSALSQVQKVYPKVKEQINGYTVAVPGNRKAYYYFGVNRRNKVETLVLALTTQDCVN